MEYHELANIFPLLHGAEFDRLKDDIKENGLIDPVWLCAGKILDGRNRYRACQDVGVECRYADYEGDDPLAFVISKNIHRRHLDAGQKAALTVAIKPMLEERAKQRQEATQFGAGTVVALVPQPRRSREEAAEIVGVSPRTIQQVWDVADEAPDLLDKIKGGEMSAKAADRELRKRKREQSPPPERLYSPVLVEDYMEKYLSSSGQKFDLVIADPPYNVTDLEWDKRGTDSEFLLDTTEWLSTIRDVLADEYHLFYFCSPRYAADIEFVMRELGLDIKSRVVWHRRNMSMGSKAKEKFVDSWEMIFHCGNHHLNFPAEWSDAWFDVQQFAVPQSNFEDEKLHPTQKPLGLIERLVEFGSSPGGSVLDPFAGSGTTGDACHGTRKCVLIESDPEYAKIIRRRLKI